MRISQALLSCAVSLTMSIGMAPPAIAQTFFQKLFGFGGSSAKAPPAAAPSVRRLPSSRFYNRTYERYQSRPAAGADDEIGPPDSRGPYRTMCVRACDGYYFPVRHNAWRRNFSPDVKSCRSACGDEARLFYYPLKGGSIDTMVDLAGRPYRELSKAYQYRKTLVAGCRCKPLPWSYEEVARHRRYEETETAARESARMVPTAAEANASPGGEELQAGESDESAVRSQAAAGEDVARTSPPINDGSDEERRIVETPRAISRKFSAEPRPAVTTTVSGRGNAERDPARRRSNAAASGIDQAKYEKSGGWNFLGPSGPKLVWPGD